MTVRWLILAVLLLWPGASAPAATPEEMLKEAGQLEKSGKPQRAVQVYEDFLKQNADHSQVPEARYRLGKCFDAMGMVDEAVARLKEVTDAPKQGNFRNRPDAFYTLAKLYAANKKYDEAIKTFEKMLAEGAGLYEDEVLGLTGGYYAILGKYPEAAAKFNLLRRKGDAATAEQAAYKLAMLWLRAEDTGQVVAAIQDLASSFPRNDQIPDLLLRAADLFRQKKQFDKTISLCEQLRQRYPRAPEALGANYLLGLCYRDKGEFAKAAEALDALGRSKEVQTRGLAAEAMLQSAELYFKELKDSDKAMSRYEEAARLARESEGERKNEILEQCYFRLAEQQYQKKSYAAAMDYYVKLRSTGSRINVMGRILECEAQLNKTSDAIAPETVTEADVDLLKKRIVEKPGTAEAAEAELFLLDRRFSAMSRKGNNNVATLGPEYEKLSAAYPKDVLASQAMGAYAWQMAGMSYASGTTREDMAKAVAAFEKCMAVDATETNPYRQTALENIALCAERAGDKKRAAKAYADLIDMSGRKLDAAKQDAALERKTLEYVKSLATRSDTPELIDGTITLTTKLIAEHGPMSDLSRESRFYLGELYLLKKDFSNSAKTFREFIRVYGPKQDAMGEFADGPWKPAKVDEKVEQVYEAAVRIAHAWYLQGHEQNMVTAYQWIVRNLPTQNKRLAEAQYWLGMEMLKGKAGETREAKKKAAETLWTTVVNPHLPSLDLDDTRFRKGYYFWTDDEDAQKYVKGAMMRAGQLFSEVEDHDTAAAVFREYLSMFSGSTARGGRQPKNATARDEMADIARYALGREYAALRRTTKLLEVYRPYLNGHRDDRFRISGLRLMAYHAAQDGLAAEATEAYATILDEYGENRLNDMGRPIPLPMRDRLRQGQQTWDGVRIAPPMGLDMGDVRYALGFLYWKGEDWLRCAKTLSPFVDDAKLRGSKSRAQALFMAGQSCFKLYDETGGLAFMRPLIKDYPRFEAIEEAYVWAARGYAAAKAWPDLELVCKNFVAEWPKSDRRSRMDVYSALARGGQGQTDAAKRLLLQIAGSDTYEDVKADAYYWAGRFAVAADPAEAMKYFEASVAYPREASLLEAGRCAIKLRQLEKARDYLERGGAIKGDPRILAETRVLLTEVQKELAKQNGKGK
ncbi:MAG: tetratricopeptide repeat protein [Tepidisphaerales bacterium]